MSLTTKPSGVIKWADTLTNNSPTNGANREEPTLSHQTIGWTYGQKPPYQYWNSWNYNVYKVLDWLSENLTTTEQRITDLEQASEVSAFIFPFVNTAWITSGANKELTIPANTHGKGTAATFVVQEDLGANLFQEVESDKLTNAVTGDITLRISTTSAFDGRVVIR